MKKTIIIIIIGTTIIVFILIFTIKAEKGSFDNLVLSNFDESSIKTMNIIYSSQSNIITHITSDYNTINNLIFYLNTLNLRQNYFRDNNFEDNQYRIGLYAVYDNNKDGFIMLEINNKNKITIFFNTPTMHIEKTYKITNAEIDYNKLDEIFNMMK